MTAPAGLRLFGFPLHIRPGFALLLVLVVVVNSGPLGLWLALGLTAFTLLHELGHAFAARATGARAEISLDFLAGYASFQPTRPLKPWSACRISFSGPAIQIAAGLALLVGMGVNPFDWHDVSRSDAAVAMWWAGPMIGLFNLLPVVPLDGGHIVGAAVEKALPDKGRTVMLYVSITLTLGGAVVLYLSDDLRRLSTFLVFPLLMQLQLLSATAPVARRKELATLGEASASAERAACWHDGAPPDGQGTTLSPWWHADRALQGGEVTAARRTLLAGFAENGRPQWWPPDDAPPARLAALVDILPEPLPTGHPYAELVLGGVLTRIGRFEQAADYAAALHARHPSAGSALIVARCAAALGESDLALRWLEVAVATSAHPTWLAHAIDTATEFATMRTTPAMQQLRAELVSA